MACRHGESVLVEGDVDLYNTLSKLVHDWKRIEATVREGCTVFAGGNATLYNVLSERVKWFACIILAA